jgi:hypothetical protein
VNLAGLLPDAHAANLLVAMLRDGDAAREAWSQWTFVDRDRPLLPLLYDSVRRNALSVDAPTATLLRSAYVTESLRSRAYARIVEELSALLAGIPFLLVKGAAVGPLYYADPALRHAHDVELLVPSGAAVRTALAGSAFQRTRRHYVHTSGLPLRVYTRLFVPRFRFDERALWEGAVGQTLNATDALSQALIHASRSLSRHSGRWVCDAHAIRRGSVDWVRLVATVGAVGAALPVAAQLRWLHEVLGVPVPGDVLAALDARAARAGLLERVVVGRGLALDRLSRRVLR